MINFFESLFKPPSQPQPLFFDGMNKKLQDLLLRIQHCQDKCQEKQKFAQQLISRGLESLSHLSAYLYDIKLYVVFMGTMSSGKSTFINSLLGQQLLPSGNQECTSQFLFITHHDSYIIDDQPIQDLENASRHLLEIQQNNNKFEFVKIQGPSLFHSSLPSDLRKRVVFMDTPGIKFGEQEQFKDPCKKVEDLIGNNLRINVWVSNYTTFDNEKRIAYQFLKTYEPIISSLKIPMNNLLLDIIPEVEQSEIIQDNLQESKEVSSELKSLPVLLFVLNKYDEKKEEDLGIEMTIQEICNKIGDKNFIYKISAIRSLQYQIMNFGNSQAVEKFLHQYFIDYGSKENFTDLKSCKQYCTQKIKNNHNLIRNQDFQLFSNQLTSQIKSQINQGFNGELLNDAIQSLILVELVQSTTRIQLDEQGFDQLNEFTEKAIQSYVTTYKGIISKLETDAKTQIEKEITISKEKLNEQNCEDIINAACKATIVIFKELDDKINDVNREFKSIIMEKISTIFTQAQFMTSQIKVGEVLLPKKKQNSVVDCYLNLFEQFSDKQVYHIQKQSFEQYHNDIQRTLGVKMNSVQQSVGIASTGLSLITFFGSRFIMSVIFFSSPIFAIVGASLLSFNFDFIFAKKWYSLPIMQQSLEEWKGALIKQLHFLCDNYLQINKQTFEGLSNLLESLNG